MKPDFPGALWIPSPNFGRLGDASQKRYVIVHGTAGGSSAQNIAAFFADPASQVSTHYIVGQDGTIVQTVEEQEAAWGNGVVSQGHDPWWSPNLNPNLITISIEHVKPSLDNSNTLTPVQQQTSFQLILNICQRWMIPMKQADSSGGITGHFSIDPVNRRNCPGPYPWEALWQFLQEGRMIDITNPTVTHYFQQVDAEHWKCIQTGHIVQFAILKFYRAFGCNALCGLTYLGLPQSDEIAVAGHPGVVRQKFERGVLYYDPQHVIDRPPDSGDVYMAHIP